MTLFMPGWPLKVGGLVYAALVWWAAVYLNHHFLFDLLGAALYVGCGYVVGWLIVHKTVEYFGDRLLTNSSERWMALSEKEVDTEMIVISVEQNVK